MGEMMTGGATVAGESGETTSETATQEPESVQIQPLTMSAWTLAGPWWVLGQSLTGLLDGCYIAACDVDHTTMSSNALNEQSVVKACVSTRESSVEAPLQACTAYSYTF